MTSPDEVAVRLSLGILAALILVGWIIATLRARPKRAPFTLIRRRDASDLLAELEAFRATEPPDRDHALDALRYALTHSSKN